MIEFGGAELGNYNERLEVEIKERKDLNFDLKLFKRKMHEEQKRNSLFSLFFQIFEIFVFVKRIIS